MITNPERVIFPERGFTKRDVVEHYQRVAPLMLPHLRGRPLTLERFPQGIGKKGFMQKNAGKHFPETILRIPVQHSERETSYPAIERAEDLAYLANQGTLTFHIWQSRLPHLWRADRIVFDLDPPAGGHAAAREAAGLVRALLDEIELPSCPVVTGSKGYHVVCNIEPTLDMDESTELSRVVSALATARSPAVLTSEFRKARRAGRVFVDWLRNRPAQTVVAPYSLRPRPAAPVALPIAWHEIDDAAPDRWALDTVHERLQVPDPLIALAPTSAQAPLERARRLAADASIELEPFDRFRS